MDMMMLDLPLYFVVLCLLAGAVYAGALYFVGPQRLSRRLRWLLAVLRAAAVALICFLLLGPTMKQKVHEKQKPHIVLAQDISASVKASADSTFDITTLADRLEDRCRVSVERFGSATHTDIDRVMEKYRDDDVAALVLATDGINNRGQNPASLSEKLLFPVYSVALGDTTPQRDAAIGNLRYNRIATLGNTFPVEIPVSATLLKGSRASLSIKTSKGQTIQSKELVYSDENFFTVIPLEIEAKQAGLQQYEALLTITDGERNHSNNHTKFFIDVIDSRNKIALIGNAPHPDLAALKNAMEGNPNYEAQILYASDIDAGKVKLQDSNYSLVVLHNLPSNTHTTIHGIDNIPQIFIIGAQTDLGRFNALHTGLEIVAKSHGMNEVTATRNEAFTLFTLDNADATTIEALPPLSAPFGEAHTSADIQILFNARLGNINSRLPLIAATTSGGIRRAFIWGEGLWRWRLSDYLSNSTHAHVDKVLQQLMHFAALQGNRERLQVETDRSNPADEPIELRATYYNESYEIATTEEIKLMLSGESSKSEYLFSKDGDHYRLTLPPLEEGVYHYQASTTNGITTEGSFAVETGGAEMQRLTADHELLATIATITGGEVYSTNQIANLAEKLSAIKPVIHSHIRYSELSHLPLVIILILLLLAAEWVLRKYNGEI